MATNRWLNRTSTEVAQVWKGTVTTTTNAHTYILTLTLDDGTTAAITYAVANPPDTTVTLVAAGIIAAWNASTHPAISRITATQDAGQVILTADTAGVPFSVAATGTGTWSGTGNTTANVGIYDYGTARNWSLNAVPISTDNVVISGPASGGECLAIKYGLNQSSVAINAFNVTRDYTADIGRFEDGTGYYLRVDPDSMDYRGASQLALIDIGSANIPPQIEVYGQASTGKHALYIKGSNISTLEVKKGNVGVAMLTGDTATVATVLCSYLENPQSDVDMKIGSGVTLTTLTQSGGKCELGCAATTVSVSADGVLTTVGTGTIATLNVNGKVFPCSTGAITTVNLYAGILDFRPDRSARTVATLNILPRADQGPTIYSHPTITYTNQPIVPTTTGAFRWFTVG